MIEVIAGTNRSNSNALRISKLLVRRYEALGTPAQVLDLSAMPAEIFLPSAYEKKPEAWLTIQDRVLRADGLHVVTPEYNGSFSGALKYFIDMLKFPESFERKPVAFVGEAAGVWGGIRSVEQLQMVFGYRNARVLPERVFIPAVHKKLNEAGELTDPFVSDLVDAQVKAFVAWIKALNNA